MSGDHRLKVGVPRETFPGEHRVAPTPPVIPALVKAGRPALGGGADG